MEEEGRKKKRMRRCREKKRKEERKKNRKPGANKYFHVSQISLRAKFLIRTKFKVINICRDKMGGLVRLGTKFQMTPNYRDEMHILPYF
jgi:hypothetical protein